MRDKINLFIVGFGRPDLLREQVRLLNKHLLDEHEICVVDNTLSPMQLEMEATCRELGIGYQYAVSKKNEHNEALNFAAAHIRDIGSKFFGFLDHDVFPRRETRLIPILKKAGFFGVGQRHAATGHQYLWPGFCFFSKKWLNGRQLNFDGIRAEHPRDNGDCGSMNWPLFEAEDWRRLWPMEHGYIAIREPDEFGLQSWGVEILGDWIHLTNASHWMLVPQTSERDRILSQMVAGL